MRAVVVEVQRIDDAHASEGDPLLRGEPLDLVDGAERQGVLGSVGETAIKESSHIPQRDRAIAHATRGRLDLDKWLEPQHAARSIAHDLGIDAALTQARFDREGDLVGADRARGTVAGDVDADHARTSCARATALRMRSTSQRPRSRPLTMAAGPRAQLPRQ